MKKGKIPKCLNKRFSIQEVEDEKTSKARIWAFFGIMTILSAFVLYAIYYLLFILRVNVVISTEYRFNHISIFARTITVEENFGDDIEKDWIISGYPFLKAIVVKENSLNNLKSLKVSDNPMLKSIETDYGYWDGCTFCSVESVTITSTSINN